MDLKWTSKALSDLARRYEFLAPVNKPAAAPPDLLTNPRIGERLDEFEPREVRRIVVGHYEMRYEIQKSTIYVLRLWHIREDRARQAATRILERRESAPIVSTAECREARERDRP